MMNGGDCAFGSFVNVTNVRERLKLRLSVLTFVVSFFLVDDSFVVSVSLFSISLS